MDLTASEVRTLGLFQASFTNIKFLASYRPVHIQHERERICRVRLRAMNESYCAEHTIVDSSRSAQIQIVRPGIEHRKYRS
eukprot:SAG31_NODE_4363_length_3311_cov_2.091532_3_plen_81_part_00